MRRIDLGRARLGGVGSGLLDLRGRRGRPRPADAAGLALPPRRRRTGFAILGRSDDTPGRDVLSRGVDRSRVLPARRSIRDRRGGHPLGRLAGGGGVRRFGRRRSRDDGRRRGYERHRRRRSDGRSRLGRSRPHDLRAQRRTAPGPDDRGGSDAGDEGACGQDRRRLQTLGEMRGSAGRERADAVLRPRGEKRCRVGSSVRDIPRRALGKSAFSQLCHRDGNDVRRGAFQSVGPLRSLAEGTCGRDRQGAPASSRRTCRTKPRPRSTSMPSMMPSRSSGRRSRCFAARASEASPTACHA